MADQSQYRDKMEFLFQKPVRDWKLLGMNVKQQEGRDWFRTAALSAGSINRSDLFKQQQNWVLNIDAFSVGRMFLFNYDAKLKKELPYWDAYPLIFPFSLRPDGFLGINMHYLPPVLRATAMDQIYTILNNDRYDDRTKARLSYSWLKSASTNKWFAPCVKRYLVKHVRSVYIYIKPREWDYVLMLPLARFQKASQETVWMESRRIMGI